MTSLADLRQHLPGASRVLAGRHELGGLDEIKEMVRRQRSFRGTGLGSADIKLAIHGDRVAVDDLTAKPLRQRQRQRRLPAARWPKDNHQ